jgi:PIN domain nuclease of toxin-antitoxin system
MNLLLDTCAFLWIAKNDANLSPAALEAFRCADNAVFLSSVSAWEISVKWSMGKLALPYPPPQFIPRERKRHFINKLPFTEKDGQPAALIIRHVKSSTRIVTVFMVCPPPFC